MLHKLLHDKLVILSLTSNFNVLTKMPNTKLLAQGAFSKVTITKSLRCLLVGMSGKSV